MDNLILELLKMGKHSAIVHENRKLQWNDQMREVVGKHGAYKSIIYRGVDDTQAILFLKLGIKREVEEELK